MATGFAGWGGYDDTPGVAHSTLMGRNALGQYWGDFPGSPSPFAGSTPPPSVLAGNWSNDPHSPNWVGGWSNYLESQGWTGGWNGPAQPPAAGTAPATPPFNPVAVGQHMPSSWTTDQVNNALANGFRGSIAATPAWNAGAPPTAPAWGAAPGAATLGAAPGAAAFGAAPPAPTYGYGPRPAAAAAPPAGTPPVNPLQAAIRRPVTSAFTPPPPAPSFQSQFTPDDWRRRPFAAAPG